MHFSEVKRVAFEKQTPQKATSKDFFFFSKLEKSWSAHYSLIHPKMYIIIHNWGLNLLKLEDMYKDMTVITIENFHCYALSVVHWKRCSKINWKTCKPNIVYIKFILAFINLSVQTLLVKS